MPLTSAGLTLTAEILGFFSSFVLSWQTYRLIRHQRSVKDLRDTSKEPVSPKIGELAKKGAETLEQTVARWDPKDHKLIITGLIGLTLSFAVKIIAILLF